ncbi:hypothetical protein Tco_1042908 [Tanacetum coccineum]|uniref:Uncharacterized protein n=1 Tax=Tanacetum coccineum TaxID=301880 RepID=A0ABQ5GKI1_9ASTR
MEIYQSKKEKDEKHDQKKSAQKPTTHRLYHALMEASRLVVKTHMDKEVADKVKDHKRKHDSDDDEDDDDDDDDDDDEGPSAGSNQGRSTKRRKSDSAASGSAKPPPKADDQSSKEKRESEASCFTTNTPFSSSTGWQITDTREAGVDSSMHRSDPESEHSEQSTDDMSKQDEGNVSDMEDTDNAHIPKVSTTTRTGKKKLCKADLEGPAFNLVKAFHKNSVFLQYQMDECHKLLTNKVDVSNPEGHQILRNIYEPLPLGGPPGDKERKIALSLSKPQSASLTIDFGLEELVPSLWVESKREYDISAVYGITHWWFRRKEFYINKHSDVPLIVDAVRSTRSNSLVVISVKVSVPSQYSRKTQPSAQDRQDQSSHSSQHVDGRTGAKIVWGLTAREIESYQTKINLERPNWDAADYYFKEDYTIVPKPRAVVYRDRNDQRKLMRLNELHKFSDGTLSRVMEKLDHMVKDFHLFEYNKGMETRKWSEDDKRRSKDFITAIEKRLQIRRIYRSLESFVGGRIRDIDYRLINRTT